MLSAFVNGDGGFCSSVLSDFTQVLAGILQATHVTQARATIPNPFLPGLEHIYRSAPRLQRACFVDVLSLGPGTRPFNNRATIRLQIVYWHSSAGSQARPSSRGKLRSPEGTAERSSIAFQPSLTGLFNSFYLTQD